MAEITIITAKNRTDEIIRTAAYRYAETIYNVEGRRLPEIAPVVDYDKIIRDANLEYLSCLLDEAKFKVLIDTHLSDAGNDNITVGELDERLKNYDFNSAIIKVAFSVQRSLFPNQYVKDFFKYVEWQKFAIDEINRLIQNESLQLDDNQKATVKEMVINECKKGIFNGTASKDGSLSEHICNIVNLLVLFDIPLLNIKLSELTPIPWFGFSSKNAFLAIRHDDISILDFTKYATRYFFIEQQEFRWRL